MRKHSDDRQSKEYRLLKFRYKLLMQYGPTVDIETYRFDSILGCHYVNKTVLDEILSISDDIKAFYDVKEAFMALDDVDENQQQNMTWKREYFNFFTWSMEEEFQTAH